MSTDPVLGMYRASVADNQDPLNQARVTLFVPQVLGDAESAWASPSSPTNTVPAVNATVWVQFDGGDLTKPVYSPLGIKTVQDQVGDLSGQVGGLINEMPPKEPTALTLTTAPYETSEGNTLAAVTATWTAPTENQDGTTLTDLSHYLVQTSYDSEDWAGAISTEDLRIVYDSLHTGRTFNVRVQAIDTNGNASLWATASIVTASSTTPPPVPSTPVATGVLGGLRVAWDGLDTTGSAMPPLFDHVQVQRDTSSTFASPVTVATLRGADFTYDSVQNYASAYFYRLVAYSRVGVASAPSGSASGTAKQAVNTDILDAAINAAKIAVGAVDQDRLAANAVTAQAIADGAVQAGKLAAKAVGTPAIADNAVTGAQIADATIGSAKIINAAIGTAQIADAAINDAKIANLDAGKITTGSLDAARIAAGSLDAAKITSGTLTSAQIQAGSITGDRLAANTITANQIAASTITANQMAAGTITAASGVIGSIDASKITVGKVTASQIDATNLVVSGGNVSGTVSTASSAGTVTGSIGAGVTVPAGQVSGTIPSTTTISGNSITTGTVSASVIAARSITTDKMVIGDTSNILLDPQFTQNSSAWNWSSNVVRTASSDASVPTGAPASWVAKIINQTSTNTDLNWKHTNTTTTGMPVTPGESYYVEAWVVASSDCNASIRFFLTTWDASGNNVVWPGSTLGNVAPSSAQTWTKISGQITIPAGKYLAAFGIGSLATTPTTATGSWFVTNVKMRKAVDNSLVVAGSITADKLDANAINGKTITGSVVQTASSGNRTVISSVTRNNQTVGEIDFYTDVSTDKIGSITAYGPADGTSRGIKITAPAASAVTDIPIIFLNYDPDSGASRIDVTAHDLWLTGLLNLSTSGLHSLGNLDAPNLPSGAWTTFTPTWTTSTGSATPSFGNAAVNCAWNRVGRTITARYDINFGSTTTFGTSPTVNDNWRLSLPVTAAGTTQAGGFFDAAISSGGRVTCRAQLSTTTTIELVVCSGRVDGAAITNNGAIDGVTPWSWTTSGSLKGIVTYEAAS